MGQKLSYYGEGFYGSEGIYEEDGSHSYYIACKDKAGNTAYTTTSFEVDTTPPSPLTISGNYIEKPPYDTSGAYEIDWIGGTDVHFNKYELYENSSLIYTGSSHSKSRSGMSEGDYEYQVIAYDNAGHSTASSFFDVFVDTKAPSISITGTSGFFGLWTLTYSTSDPEPSSGIDRVVVSDSDTPYVTCFNGWCMVMGGSYVKLTAYDKAGNPSEPASTEGAPADVTPPKIISSSPSGVINYNDVTLEVKTNEPAYCYYGANDKWDSMEQMDTEDNIYHTANLYGGDTTYFEGGYIDVYDGSCSNTDNAMRLFVDYEIEEFCWIRASSGATTFGECVEGEGFVKEIVGECASYRFSDGATSEEYGVYDFGFCSGEGGEYYAWWNSEPSWNNELNGLYCTGEMLKDGLYVYHVQCEDFVGNSMDSSKTMVFYIDTSGSHAISIPDYGNYWSVGWNTFFLPKLMLDDINFNCGNKTYSVEQVLASLNKTGTPTYTAVWYYNGENWDHYFPGYAYNDLTKLNDEISNPYFIYMTAEDRLEIESCD